MAEQSDILKGSQYKKSTPQERFARQLDRDMSRPSGPRLSQSAIRTLITNDTASWAKSIFEQKAAQNYGANFASAQTQISTTSSSQSISSSSSDSGGGTAMTPNESSNAKDSEDSGLEDGTQVGQILYWTGDAWQFLDPPSGSTLNVLTIQNGNLSWTATQDC